MQNILADCEKEVNKVFNEAYAGTLKTQAGKSMMDSFEASINQTLNSARDKAGNEALDDLQCWNRLKAMVFAGSKGSNLNISQIMACVGQ
jgi:DNA-directed RNA polymerase II subunit RPB1